jgi:hypothetical protein
LISSRVVGGDGLLDLHRHGLSAGAHGQAAPLPNPLDHYGIRARLVILVGLLLGL